ncbi:MAG: DUF3108 domain-containing protein [Nitrospirae bacterium]|nr:DUF3108 domain-containing protein [Nitrospirota bacterium]
MREHRTKNPEHRFKNTKNISYCLYSVFCVLCSMVFALCSAFFPLKADAAPLVPEKLIYTIHWSGIKAGNAYLETNNSAEGITITSRAESADFISVFYRVEDIAQSTLYPGVSGYPKNYKINLTEGRHRRERETHFENKQGSKSQKVIYQNKVDNEMLAFNLEKQAFDPLSAFYEIRKRPLQVGRSEYLDIFDNKKLWNVEVQVLKRERITVPAGEFNTIVIKPLLQSEGIFMRKGEILIWLTDDDRKVPVMVKSKIKIGSIIVKLTEGKY